MAGVLRIAKKIQLSNWAYVEAITRNRNGEVRGAWNIRSSQYTLALLDNDDDDMPPKDQVLRQFQVGFASESQGQPL